ILDDCSTDDTIQIIKDYMEKYSLDSWIVSQNKTNQRHYRTFINFTKLVQEGIVFFSDQDDICDSHKIEIMLPIFDRENVSMVFCKSRLIDESGNIISSPDTSDGINT
ncbi:glycosyltransferase, partial [Streptococcus suis]